MSGCEALYHHPDCPCPTCPLDTCDRCPNGVTLTTDHFTPKKIRRVWGVPPNGNDPKDLSNLQTLNGKCHVPKDWSTPSRASCVKRQQKGKTVTLRGYLNDVMTHDLRDASTGKPIRLNPGESVVFKGR